MARALASRAELLPVLAEVFREHGYEGASLALIGQRTGLGKGSLYHFFPGGKEEMAGAVLDAIHAWFEAEIYLPLRQTSDPKPAIQAMLAATDTYFRSGHRVCLVGALALGDVRDRFAERIVGYFIAWRDALSAALMRGGLEAEEAGERAEDAVATIQGALVAARATHDPGLFGRALDRIERRLTAGLRECASNA